MLLKLDCDGCEDSFFFGLQDVLRTQKVLYILAEVDKGDEWAYSLMNDFDYATYAVDGPLQNTLNESQFFFPGTKTRLDGCAGDLGEALATDDLEHTAEMSANLMNRRITRDTMFDVVFRDDTCCLAPCLVWYNILFVHQYAQSHALFLTNYRAARNIVM